MKKTILYPLEYLFVSQCNFSRSLNSKGDFYDTAYKTISLLMGINLASIMMVFKFFIGFEYKLSTIMLFIIFFFPMFILNYYIFMKNNRKIILYKEIKATSISSIIYFVCTMIFMIISAYINRIDN